MFELRHDTEVFCWLRTILEPRYQVVAVPESGYFQQQKYCYRILDGNQVTAELSGQFPVDPPGDLVRQARELVSRLKPHASTAATGAGAAVATDTPRVPAVASRQPPERSPVTWFSSGRAAFWWLIVHQVQPRRIFLPTFVCWSLIDVVLKRLPQIDLCFYPVDRSLHPRYPDDMTPEDALVWIHFFGYDSPPPEPTPAALLEDVSHCPISRPACPSSTAFGSVRKVYATADGGYIRRRLTPLYDADRNLPAWLRCSARDWTDLREAENMIDRDWRVSDISSQSLSAVLTTPDDHLAAVRRQNERILRNGLSVGTSLRPYTDDECPLLHNRFLPTKQDRDDLRDFLARQQVYCSIHWPVHPRLSQAQDEFDCADALWMADHGLSFPVSQHLCVDQMELICAACDAWQAAGSARFVSENDPPKCVRTTDNRSSPRQARPAEPSEQ